MTTTETRLLTAADLLQRKSDSVRDEPFRGMPCGTMSTGELHGPIVTNLVGELYASVKLGRLGTLLASDATVRFERDPDTVREPDIAFTSSKRLPLDAWNPGYSEVVPDLVVEVASPGDSRRALNDRAQMWLRHGVRVVWVVHLDTRTVDRHRSDDPAVTLGETDELEGGDGLPGFSCAVGAVFDA